MIKVIWTDDAIFETGLDSHICFISWRIDTAMESQYLKPTFKSGKTTMGIWGAILLEKKVLVNFLFKEKRITLQIYVDQMLKQMSLPFYEQQRNTKGFMILIDNRATYHTSKFTMKFCSKASLLCMKCLVSSSDLKPIKNF